MSDLNSQASAIADLNAVQTAPVVFVFIWEHRHGTDVYACKTQERADAKAVSIALEWFDHEFGDLSGEEDVPQTDEEKVDYYWRNIQDESYEIVCTQVEE